MLCLNVAGSLPLCGIVMFSLLNEYMTKYSDWAYHMSDVGLS